MVAAVAPFFHANFESVPPGAPGTENVHIGFDGLRAAWLGWMEPWLTYRTEIKQSIDARDRVLLLTQDYGRRESVAEQLKTRGSEEVKVDGSAVWTISDGKVARAEFFAYRADAFKAAGLTEGRPMPSSRCFAPARW